MHSIQYRDSQYNKQMKSLLWKVMLTKCEVSPLCQNIAYISIKGMGDRVSRHVFRNFYLDRAILIRPCIILYKRPTKIFKGTTVGNGPRHIPLKLN